MKNANYESDNFSKRHRTEWHDFLWNRILDRLAVMKSKKQARESFNALFGDYEKKIVARRLAALVLIKEGVGTREIGRILWLSSNTVSNLKKHLIGHRKTYKSRRQSQASRKKYSIDRVVSRTWLDDFLDVDLWELIKNPPRPVGMGIKRHARYR